MSEVEKGEGDRSAEVDPARTNEIRDYHRAVLGGENERDYVLRGHLYVEMELTRILELSLVRPEVLRLEQSVPFAQKLTLVEALGHLDAEEAPAFRRLNRLRNEFAHHLHREMEAEDGPRLFATLGPEAKKMLAELRALTPDLPGLNDPLRGSMAALWALTSVERLFIQREPGLAHTKRTPQRDPDPEAAWG